MRSVGKAYSNVTSVLIKKLGHRHTLKKDYVREQIEDNHVEVREGEKAIEKKLTLLTARFQMSFLQKLEEKHFCSFKPRL